MPVIRTSDRVLFKQCRQKWDWSAKMRSNLEPAHTLKPLAFGTAIHKGLSTWYEPSTPREIEPAIQAFISELGTFNVENLNIEQEEEIKQMQDLGIGMLKHYFSWCADKDDFEVIFVEREFHVPIASVPGMPAFPWEDNIVYSFTPDGLVRDRHGRYWILEHKTAIQLVPSTEWLMMDEQCGSYIWGCQKALDIKIEGVIYNSLKKKTPQPLRRLLSGEYSKAKNQDTTYEIAYRTLVEEYDEKIPERYKEFLDYLFFEGNTFFRRDHVRRNPKEVAYQENQIWMEALEMLNPRIYRNPGRMHCTGCPFFAPCVTKYEGGDYEFVLRQLFKERVHV